RGNPERTAPRFRRAQAPTRGSCANLQNRHRCEKSYREDDAGRNPERGTRGAYLWARQRIDSPNGNHAPARCSASSKRRTPEQRESVTRLTGATSERASSPRPERLTRRRKAATGKRMEFR